MSTPNIPPVPGTGATNMPPMPGQTPKAAGLDKKIEDTRAERAEQDRRHGYTEYDPGDNDPGRRKGSKGPLIGILAVVGIIGLGGLAWWLLADMGGDADKEEQTDTVVSPEEAKLLELEQQLADAEFENLEKDINSLESQRQLILDDTLKVQLQEKYERARLEVERLQQQLKSSTAKSAKEIADLRAQIATLRDLLKHYLEEIDRLNQENAALRSENEQVKQENSQLSSQVAANQSTIDQQKQTIQLAEKLNVTGVSLNMLNKKGKVEKKLKNAKQMVVSFTIPQNNTTPIGTKTIYLRITTPEGQVLTGGGNFEMEGTTLEATARKDIDYGGEEIGGITIYYDVRTPLTAGQYTVQLFTQGYRLCNSHFTLQ